MVSIQDVVLIVLFAVTVSGLLGYALGYGGGYRYMEQEKAIEKEAADLMRDQ